MSALRNVPTTTTTNGGTTMPTMTDPMPAHKTQAGFPLAPCYRCGGSGHYSYNAMHGTVCYGCNGSGWNIAKGAAKAHADYTQAVRDARRVMARDLEAGDEVSGFKFMSDASDGNWRTVTSVERTDETCGHSAVGTPGTANYVRTDHYWMLVAFDGGEPERIGETSLFRRKGTVDPAPYLRRALWGWRKNGCQGGTA